MPVLSLGRLALAATLCAASLPGEARAAPPARTAGKAAAPAPAGPGVAWSSIDAQAVCARSRRKLWQPGEGWLVKTVTVCR